MRVDNAIIMAAGASSRFAPLSYEKHKALTVVKGQVLIERQIEQLMEVGIQEIVIITGYKANQFEYLKEKYGVKLLHNPEYLIRNNNGSIWVAREILGNTYICSADNYFSANPFEAEVDGSYYAAEYAEGKTKEWCMTEDENGYIKSVTIGGEKAWYMLGHSFWSSDFSISFIDILKKEYNLPKTVDKLWESIFLEHLDVLKMKIRKYAPDYIYEFDTLDELRIFDTSYVCDTRSSFIKQAANQLQIKESDVYNITAIKDTLAEAIGFEFDCCKGHFKYHYKATKLD